MVNKIIVVIAVLVTILIGLFVYLFFTNRKMKKIEKELKSLRDSLKS